MQFESLPIDGPLLITPRVFEDARGYFMETYKQDLMAQRLNAEAFIQENESSSRYGVIRGLHFQKDPHAQAKLVRAVWGSIYDVIVDIRPGSPTYGKHLGVWLSADNKKQLFVPRGFAHGFCVVSPLAIVQYKIDSPYCPQAEGAYRYDSPQLGIEWPVSPAERVVSAKDLQAPTFEK